jgi:hypothetical protein
VRVSHIGQIVVNCDAAVRISGSYAVLENLRRPTPKLSATVYPVLLCGGPHRSLYILPKVPTPFYSLDLSALSKTTAFSTLKAESRILIFHDLLAASCRLKPARLAANFARDRIPGFIRPLQSNAGIGWAFIGGFNGQLNLTKPVARIPISNRALTLGRVIYSTFDKALFHRMPACWNRWELRIFSAVQPLIVNYRLTVTDFRTPFTHPSWPLHWDLAGGQTLRSTWLAQAHNICHLLGKNVRPEEVTISACGH